MYYFGKKGRMNKDPGVLDPVDTILLLRYDSRHTKLWKTIHLSVYLKT